MLGQYAVAVSSMNSNRLASGMYRLYSVAFPGIMSFTSANCAIFNANGWIRTGVAVNVMTIRRGARSRYFASHRERQPPIGRTFVTWSKGRRNLVYPTDNFTRKKFEIIKRAAAGFHQRGYHGSSVRSIAQASGMVKSKFFYLLFQE
jgi:hypothetical protein